MDRLHRIFQFVAGLVVVALIAQPVVACVIPGQTMTAAEHACCMKMASMCDSARMPQSHSCCKKAASPHLITLAKVRGGDLVVPALATQVARELPKIAQSGPLHQMDSPPGSPPKYPTILRV